MSVVPSLGKLETQDPHSIWEDEAGDFTPWLAQNLDQLGEELGLDLELEETEGNVGDFFVDISATVPGRNATVIIENQLAKTDHNHLGQLITYASGKDADIIIWVTTEFRDEHRQALDWLNQRTDDSLEFYGVTISVRKIGDSLPAPEFRPVAFPNTWQKETKQTERQVSPQLERRRSLFQALIDELRTVHRFTNSKKANYDGWKWFSINHPGIYISAVLGTKSPPRIELYLNRDRESNKGLFDVLLDRRDEIEESLKTELEWHRLDTNKASRIAQVGDWLRYDDEKGFAETRDWMVGQVLEFNRVFKPNLDELG